MMNPVSNMFPVMAGTSDNKPSATENSFSKVLGDALNKVADLETESANIGEQLAAGQGPDLHTAMIAGEKASLAVQLTVQVRNRAVEAYQEIMRMQM
ncbi:flagellar hook-basal body complex protein FliE [Effusibacillus dendaii]|uniref:Flagellar hook-basal body complex protein FliE n=1 Tax=Effusibacillus dendaii TaxID=2743772 RepID=A0A7I8D5B4_9BACL|nr:flagellar hook-basal body complex protein FliE [Effusibacillus dendaii]BCJ85257.1 flagellar hook-basal body complex protein FliE [Effusibacillus dendaii]